MIQYLSFLSIMSLCLCIDIFLDTSLEAKKQKPQTRVISGNACKGAFPFMVSLQRHKRHVCGGSLIHAHWILTAAHCGSGFKAVIGSKKLTFDGGVVCDYNVVHPEFDSVSLRFDIQLVHIVYPQYQYELVRLPLGFSDAEHYTLCTTPTVMGWGYQAKDSHEVSDTLQCAEVESIPLKQCQAQHNKYLYGCICTSASSKGVCNGDGGSPLMCGSIQFGVVSFGWGRETNLPVVYSSTSYHLDFIQGTRVVVDNKTSLPIIEVYPTIGEPLPLPPTEPPPPLPPLIPLPPPQISSSFSIPLNCMLFCTLIILSKFVC